MADQFVHLHVHTEIAAGDANAKVGDLCERARRLGMPALAITDHGYLHGVPEFVRAAEAAGIRPIIGLEPYLAMRPDDTGSFGHLTVWAADDTGLRNLFRLASAPQRPDPEAELPITDVEMLAEHAEGLIGTTGCAEGDVQRLLRRGEYDEALATAAVLRDIFGADNLYVEVVAPQLLSSRVRDGLLRISTDLNLPLVATNDVHYVLESDAANNEVLLRLPGRGHTHAPGELSPGDTNRSLLSPARMRTLFADLPGACEATLEIAERCTARYPRPGVQAPEAVVPDGHSAHGWLTRLVERGLVERYPDGVPEPVRERAGEELRVIGECHRSTHFLLVAEQVARARARGIVVGPGRAANAGSVCCYALHITDLDPLEHGLLFERLLNPETDDFPGLPVDYEADRVDEVIDHTIGHHGADRVARTLRSAVFGPGAAMHEAIRLSGCSEELAGRVRRAIPPRLPLSELQNTTHQLHGTGEQLRRLLQLDERVHPIVQTARALEGLTRRHYPRHRALAISAGPMEDNVATTRDPDGVRVTQFTDPANLTECVESLGLAPLSTIADALRRLRSIGVEVDLSELSRTPSDRTTFRMLNRGNTAGVFQFEQRSRTDLLRQIRPDRFADLVAFSALLRGSTPDAGMAGAYARRKHGLEEVGYPHPELAEVLPSVLSETYGLALYEEQVMRAIHVLAGYRPTEADRLRRNLARQHYPMLDEEFMRFQAAMAGRAHSLDAAEAAWNWLWEVTGNTVLKSHMAGYAMITYWMAWLKARYPSEFTVAVAATSSTRDTADH
ncbi:DNA polymerase III subunit alpha [Enemella sp. A6]|uniref:DNA polymerase III subunit alpha n=1 Tax=Enemella sp. A6 TaxID=3440152 RepID=UPI003EB9F056